MADFTQAQLDRVNNLIGKSAGVSGVTFEDQSLTLASADDLIKLRALMKRDVESTPTHRFAISSKGT